MQAVLLNLYWWPVFLLFTLFCLLLLPCILLVFCVVMRMNRRVVVRRCIVLYGWFLVRVFVFFRPVTVVRRPVEIPVPVIFVANHNSAIDPYLFGCLLMENGFVTSWPFSIPVYNIIMKLAGYVDATSGWDTVRASCLELLEEGSSVTIWPEGHRSRDGRLARFRNGAFQLAVESGRPVVPVCILGSGQVMPPGARFLRPGKVELVLLDPVNPPATGDTNQRVLDLKRTVRGRMIQELEARGHFG